MYQREVGMLDDEQQRLLFEGGYPVLAHVAKRKKLPRPLIDNQGQVVADTAWWAAMQSAAE